MFIIYEILKDNFNDNFNGNYKKVFLQYLRKKINVNN